MHPIRGRVYKDQFNGRWIAAVIDTRPDGPILGMTTYADGWSQPAALTFCEEAVAMARMRSDALGT